MEKFQSKTKHSQGGKTYSKQLPLYFLPDQFFFQLNITILSNFTHLCRQQISKHRNLMELQNQTELTIFLRAFSYSLFLGLHDCYPNAISGLSQSKVGVVLGSIGTYPVLWDRETKEHLDLTAGPQALLLKINTSSPFLTMAVGLVIHRNPILL